MAQLPVAQLVTQDREDLRVVAALFLVLTNKRRLMWRHLKLLVEERTLADLPIVHLKAKYQTHIKH